MLPKYEILGNDLTVRFKALEKARVTDEGQNSGHVGGHVSGHVEEKLIGKVTLNALLAFCKTPKSRPEMQEYCGIKSRDYFTNKYIKPLLNNGKLKMTIPDKPKSVNQKYVSI